jgi:Flp pilus assembly protein TadB
MKKYSLAQFKNKRTDKLFKKILIWILLPFFILMLSAVLSSGVGMVAGFIFLLIGTTFLVVGFFYHLLIKTQKFKKIQEAMNSNLKEQANRSKEKQEELKRLRDSVKEKERDLKESKNKTSDGVIAFIVFVVFIIFIFILFSGNDNDTSNEPSGPTKVEAMVMGQQFLEDRLKAPSTADYPWESYNSVVENLGGNKFRYKSYVDSENSFGAKIRTNFDIVVKYVGEDNWSLISIDTW